MVLIGLVLLQLGFARAEFLPCSPESQFLSLDDGSGPDIGFCSEWNPDFTFKGNSCCSKIPTRRKRRSACAPQRRKSNYCDELTPEQQKYTESVTSGVTGDILELISQSLKRGSEQAYCSENNGFLVRGRRLIPTPENRIVLRNPHRCVDFGTDRMVGMLEWVGRRMAAGVRLVIGDISAPRGGCLSGRGGHRGHSSHTSGKDVDIGFLTVHDGLASPVSFTKQFDSRLNGWLIQQMAQNPFACIKAIFLDRRWIRKLNQMALTSKDWAREWEKIRKIIHHIPGHRNHMHVRIGNIAGAPGCSRDSLTDIDDLEDELMTDEIDL